MRPAFSYDSYEQLNRLSRSSLLEKSAADAVKAGGGLEERFEAYDHLQSYVGDPARHRVD